MFVSKLNTCTAPYAAPAAMLEPAGASPAASAAAAAAAPVAQQQAAKAVDAAKLAPSKPSTSKLQEEESTESTETSTESTEESTEEPTAVDFKKLVREVDELEKQEKAHFSAREKALAAAMEKATGQEKANLAWKTAKDKYEQAALNDISDEEKTRMNITQQGESMFQQYAKKAQLLMGVRELHQLLNSTAKSEKNRHDMQEQALSNLRSTEKKLHEVEQQEHKLIEERDKTRQEAANNKEKSDMSKSIQSSTYQASEYDGLEKSSLEQDKSRQTEQRLTIDTLKKNEAIIKKANADEAAVESSSHAPSHSSSTSDAQSQPYVTDYKQAAKIESERQDAFHQEIAHLKEEVDAARKERSVLLHAEESKDAQIAVEKSSDKQPSHSAPPKLTESADAQQAIKEMEGVEHPPPKTVVTPKMTEERAAVRSAMHESDAAESAESSAEYAQSEQAAYAAAEKESKEEEADKAHFREERERVLAQDAQAAEGLSKQLADTSEKLLEPAQQQDAAPDHAMSPRSDAETLVKGREKEVDMIMGNT
mmetsp:Transcript_29794/g.61265  ORF Transcript_29794/g.61265 Transcript_29794/m.61265 type:complete len:538 (+) Transcript_29794:120-1733(+)